MKCNDGGHISVYPDSTPVKSIYRNIYGWNGNENYPLYSKEPGKLMGSLG
jgi:hypothetical protein